MTFRESIVREEVATLTCDRIESRAIPTPVESSLSRRTHTKILVVIFFFTLPLVNPWVRGDGVGYYAYIRSLLVEHRLDFTKDWQSGNKSFTMGRVTAGSELNSKEYTPTGQIDNHWAVGPAILWAPFEVPVHLVMLTLQRFGSNVRADGFSRPYVVAMALATALYGFLGMFLSYRLACSFVAERWAFLATLGIWFASSLPVYMYFNPSWSHAHSVFVVSLLLWYWQRTRHERTLGQWIVLGLISGLVLDVHYLNIAVLFVPLFESLQAYWNAWNAPGHDVRVMVRLVGANLLYCCATLFAFLPTLITRKIIYGSPLSFGYREAGHFQWRSPYLLDTLFSSDHGLLPWTPILILSLAGLFIMLRRHRAMAAYFIGAFGVLCYLIGGDPCWDGLSSFGNRFFICLTPIYVVGLAVLFSQFSEVASRLNAVRRPVAIAWSVTALLIVWNLAFIFQWGTHMVPARGPISWRRMVSNQFIAVPQRVGTKLVAYFENRKGMMDDIEQDDIRQMQQRQRTVKTK